MAQKVWSGVSQGRWLDGENWVGGTAPSESDSWLISGTGDAPSEVGGIYEINSNPIVALYGPTAVPPLNDDPDPSLIPQAETITSPDIVVNGGSAVVGMELIDSTVASTTPIDVTGIAVMEGAYSNLLEGEISVQPTAGAALDANGNNGELDIVVLPIGSYSPEGERRDYTPNVQNTGTITVGYGAGFNIGLDGAPPALNTTGGVDGGYAAFVNTGLIDLQDSSIQVQGAFFSGAGAGFNVLDNMGTIALGPAVPGANANQDITPNAVSGSAFFDVGIGGSGTIALTGQGSDQAGAQFLGDIDGNTISVDDATASFYGLQTNTYSGSFVFDGSGGTLNLGIATGQDSAFLPVSGFAAGDSIVVRNGGSDPTLSWDASTHQLTIGDILSGFDVQQAVLTLNGNYTAADFSASASGSDIVVTTDVMPCFAAGTRIATPEGARAVEQLRVGESVLVREGEALVACAIRWIGRRSINFRRQGNMRSVRPVRIAAHAFGAGAPARDLLLSPDHAIFFEGVLIPAKHLVDGMLVRQIEVETITYFHVELDCHSLLLAEGLPVESYLDAGNRGAFANAAGLVSLYPDFAATEEYWWHWEACGCAPLVVSGEAVTRAQSLLRQRAELLVERSSAAA